MRQKLADAVLSLPEDRFFDHALQILAEALESPCGLIGCLGEGGGETLVFKAALEWGTITTCDATPNLSQGEKVGFWKTILQAGGIVIRNGNRNGLPLHNGVARLICAPILDRGRPLGLVSLYNRSTDYDDEDRRLLEEAAVVLTSILKRLLERKTAEAKRIAAEEELRRSEKRFRDIFENAVEGIYQTRINGRFVSANPSLARMLGFATPESPVGNPSFLVMQFYAEPRHRRIILHILQKQGRNVRDFKTQFMRRDGSRLWVSINARLALSIDGEPLIEGTIEDITLRKELEQQLLHSQKLDALGTLAGGIAHDFNNILSIIIGYTEIVLSRKLPTGHKARGDLERILQAGLRARDLVRQLLSFSRQEDNAPQIMGIKPLVKEATKMLRATIPSTIQIRTSIQATDEKILADPTQIHQILINLCTNAVHAMRDRTGTLKITLQTIDHFPPEGLPHPELCPGIAYQHLSVSDTGHGIDPTILGKIFDPYFTTKQAHTGSGLGLSVVHGIVKALRGAVTVESEPGLGSTFHVYLPVAQEDAAEEVIETADPLLPGQGRILLVDDEQVLAHMATEMLTGQGYNVTTMTSPLRAQQWFERHAADVDMVITDQTMPTLTGLHLIEALRKRKPDIPAILCTGHSDSVSRERLQKMGIMMIMKPVPIRELIQMIQTFLPARPHG